MAPSKFLRYCSLPLLALVLFAGSSTAQVPELAIGDKVVPKLAQLAYPNAQVESNGSVYIPYTDSNGQAQRKNIAIADTIVRPIDSGYVVIAAFEVPEDRDKAIGAISSGRVPPNLAGVPDRLEVCFTDPDGNIGMKKIGTVDSSLLVARFSSILWPDVAADGEWPKVRLLYTGWYSADNIVGSISWTTGFDTGTMAITERVPLGISKPSSSSEYPAESVTSSRVDDATVQVLGNFSGKVLKLNCGSSCVLDGSAVLASW